MKEYIKITYHFNGNIESKTPFINGLKNGLEKWWWSNRQFWTETNFINGKEYGLKKGWHSNGQISLEIPYKKDLQCGAKIEFQY